MGEQFDVEMKPRRLNVDKSLVTNTIPEYYAGKDVLVTGFTGFMGKFLIATLLTECPDIGNIYLVMRESRNTNVQKKFDKALSNPLFNKIRKNNPTAFDKLKIVKGDLTKLRIGLAESDRQEIIENVSIVFHVAASVRFDIPLKTAILLNVRGTREVCDLVLELNNPLAFLHVSTSYCHTDKPIVEEITYKPHDDWRHAVEIAENIDEFELNIICAKYIEGFPNTYTFSKSLAESVVQDLCKGKIATIICRPTVVVSTAKGPIPGWTDNFNGPIGLSIGFGKGIIRSLFVIKKNLIDFIPVDFTINSMIKAIWIQQFINSDEIMVYNISGFKKIFITLETLKNYGTMSYDTLSIDPVWHPNLHITENRYLHYINVMLFQVLPAAFADAVLKISGRKPMLLKVQRRIFNATNAIEYFILNNWDFYNHKLIEMDEYLLPSDVEAFANEWNFDPKEFFITAGKFTFEMLVKDDPNKSDLFAKKKERMKYMHYILKFAVVSTCGWSFVKLIAVPLGSWYLNYLASL